jgi:hypothetical protein
VVDEEEKRKERREGGKKRGKRNYEIIGTTGAGTRWKGWRKGRSEVNTTRAVHRATGRKVRPGEPSA